MFDGFIQIIDRLIQLSSLRRKRRKEVFNEVLKPLLTELEKVHTDYITTFGDALRLMEEPEFFDKILSLIRSRRLPLLPLREKLRSYFDTFHIPDFPAEEREYLACISKYVGVTVPWYSRFTQFALRMNLLKQKSVYHTKIPVESEEDADKYLAFADEEPSLESYAVFQYIQQMNDTTERQAFEIVSSVILGQIDSLNSRWREVTESYLRVLSVIAKL